MFGQYDLDQSTRLLWQQGPLDLLLSRSQRELWVAYRQSRPPLDETSHHEINPISVPNEDGFVSRRFSLGEKEECTLELTALTAPNPLVVKLKEPLTLMPRTETFVYVTTPLWVGFRSLHQDQCFFEIPSFALQKSWFGPRTNDGALCLTCQTRGTIFADRLKNYPLRAMTAIRLQHDGKRAFELEKLRLPVVYLPLYRKTSGEIVTPQLNVSITDQTVDLEIEKAHKEHADMKERLCKARKPVPSVFQRTLNAMIG